MSDVFVEGAGFLELDGNRRTVTHLCPCLRHGTSGWWATRPARAIRG